MNWRQQKLISDVTMIAVSSSIATQSIETVSALRCCASMGYAVMQCLSVCLSVHLSRLWILSKGVIMSSEYFSPSGSQAILDFAYRTLWRYSDRDSLISGIECRWGRKKLLFWTTSWLLINDWWSANNKCDGSHAVYYRTDSDASVNLCLSQPAWTTMTKRREENRLYLCAAVNLKRK